MFRYLVDDRIVQYLRAPIQIVKTECPPDVPQRGLWYLLRSEAVPYTFYSVW